MAQEDHLLSWSFPEYESHEHPRGWWIGFSVLSGGLLLFALLTANFLFALIIIMLAAIILYRHYHEPSEVDFIITMRGIQVGNREYRWKELEKFWLAYEPPQVKSLIITFKSSVRRHMTIPLLEQDPLQVREILGEYLEEDLDEEAEPSSDAWGRVFRI